MTTMAATPRSRGWLYGPLPDLLLGCGLLYTAAFAAYALFGPSLRALQPGYLLPLLIVLVSMPHYGGTLVRVYDQRSDRRSYAIFSVWATLALAALFVWGLFESVAASWLFTLYITWSPWHYTGQNYGLAVMFLRRRDVPLGPGTKRLLYASFVLAYGLTFLVFHGAIGVIDYNTRAVADSAIAFLPLGIPRSVNAVAFPLVATAYAATLVAAAVLLLRRAPARDLLPTAALALTQALWFSVPFGVSYLGVSTGIEPLDVLETRTQDYLLLVALGHAAQYLWVTSYYARSSGSWRGFPRYFGKTLASGVAVWTIPVLLFAPLAHGSYEYAGGLALLVASIVNLHHFILDGAIWKLRHTRIASVLIRAEPERPAGLPGPAQPGRRWLRPVIWGAAGLGLAAGLGVFWLENFALRYALLREDYVATGRVLDRLAWLGHDSSLGRAIVARRAVLAGNIPEAMRQLGLALELKPDSASLHLKAAALAKRTGDAAAATRHQREALRLSPEAHDLRNDLAWTLATSKDARLREPEEAVRLAETLVQGAEAPDANWLDTLAAAYAAAGRLEDAVRVATQALALAEARGQSELGEQIRSRLALYRQGRAFVEADAASGA